MLGGGGEGGGRALVYSVVKNHIMFQDSLLLCLAPFLCLSLKVVAIANRLGLEEKVKHKTYLKQTGAVTFFKVFVS